MIRWLLSLVILTSCSSLPPAQVRGPAGSEFLDESGYAYDPNDTSCGGFPLLKVQTMPGTCLGMVISHANNMDSKGRLKFKMPRTIVRVPNTNHFLVVDMGGWQAKAGSLFWLRPANERDYSASKLLGQLDMPHGLAFNERDQYFYLGENSRILRFRFDPATGQLSQQQIVVDNLADTAKHMHPLTQFVFSPKSGDLFLNSGAPTDHCFQKDGNYKKRCPEEVMQQMATIQKISAEKLLTVSSSHSLQAGDVEVVARGLRNSMAMAIHSTGRFLIQGENSRDFPELEEPYEEMNVIRLDTLDVRHYGWPYCYNNHATSPEWDDILIKEGTANFQLQKVHAANPFYCGRDPIPGLKDYQRPFSLIPPHAAPLAAGYYNGKMFSDLFGGQLLMSWHGHRSSGQRLVFYPVNNEGLPKIVKPANETYNFNLPNGCSQSAPLNPRGGLRKHFARYQEIISGWGPVKGLRPKGAPLGFAEGEDGSLWIVEDKNQTIVRLARSDSAHFAMKCDSTPGQDKDLNIPLLVWRNAVMANEKMRGEYNSIAQGLKTEARCLKCHESLINKDLGETPDEFSTLDFFVRSGWLIPGNPDKSLLYGALTSNGLVPAMPPAGFAALNESSEGRQIIETLRLWISGLPQDIDSRWSMQTAEKKWNIRAAPSTEGKPCGQFQPGDVFYVDPRTKAKVQANGYSWSKVYLVPGHTRLSGACPQPLDGVYYIAR